MNVMDIPEYLSPMNTPIPLETANTRITDIKSAAPPAKVLTNTFSGILFTIAINTAPSNHNAQNSSKYHQASSQNASTPSKLPKKEPDKFLKPFTALNTVSPSPMESHGA